ncbi:MAG: hypothetical protein RLN85_22060, partial [Pseudomonadales bacterium]
MNKFFSAFLLIFFSSLAFLPMVFAQEPEYASSEEAEPIPPRFSLEEFQQFARIFEQVRQNYVEDFSDAELLDMAIEGMLSRLDPHSQLLNQEERELVEDTSEGIFYGVGLELTMREGELMVVTPLDNSPAQR